MEQSKAGARDYSTWEGRERVGKETRTLAPIPQNPQAAAKARRDRWACWEEFPSGRQRAQAADKPHGSSERLESELSRVLGDLGGCGGLRSQREDCGGGQCLHSEEQGGGMQQMGLRVPTRTGEVEQRK